MIPQEIKTRLSKEVAHLEKNFSDFFAQKINPDEFRKIRLLHGIYNQQGYGLMRVKIPYGEMTALQLEKIGVIADKWANSSIHLTTRQNIEFNRFNLTHAPEMVKALLEAGLTTRESSGPTVRNIVGCPLSGVCPRQIFDIKPFAQHLFENFLLHPETQDLPRKFKISFSACDNHCSLPFIQDLGFIAKQKTVDHQGFQVVVGGGLGALPRQALELSPFIAADEIFPATLALLRVFNRAGDRLNKKRARLKFLIEKIGLCSFQNLFHAEFQKTKKERLKFNNDYSLNYKKLTDTNASNTLNKEEGVEFVQWRQQNVVSQLQKNYFALRVFVPLGHLSSIQCAQLASVSQNYGAGILTITIRQGIIIPWVTQASLKKVYEVLASIGLAQPFTESITDIVSCPGKDVCELAYTHPRRLAYALQNHFRHSEKWDQLKHLTFKMSGCPNSCGHPQTASIGLVGFNNKKEGFESYKIYLGGDTEHNSFLGLKLESVFPEHEIVGIVDRITSKYLSERTTDENFAHYVRRIGVSNLKP